MPDSHQTDVKTAIINRLQRIDGQVRGLQRMMKEGRDGADILTQMSAVLAATRRAAGIITNMHVRQYMEQSEDLQDAEVRSKLQATLDAFSNLG